MKLMTFISAGFFLVLSGLMLKKEKTTQDTPLYETKWSLKKIHNGTSVQDVQTKAFIRFDLEKKSAGGNGSCNSFGGNMVINNNEISFSNIFSTKMYCDAVQHIEDSFFKQLSNVNRYEVSGKKLSLYKDKELLLEFEAAITK